MHSTLSLDEVVNTSWDIIVIGGGPAGSLTAILLAAEGLKILILDKDFHPRPKICGATLTPYGVKILTNHNLLPTIEEYVGLLQAWIFSNGKKIIFNLQGGLAIERSVLDAHLLEKAIAVNVSVFFGGIGKVGAVYDHGATVTVQTTEKNVVTLNAKIVVGAFGLSGLSMHQNKEGTKQFFRSDSYIGAGAISPNIHRLEPRTIFMGVGKHGYVGGVQLVDGTLDTAAALLPSFVKKSGGIAEAVRIVLLEAGLDNVLLSDLQWRGTPLLSQEGVVASERYFAVGDACGYVEPFTGEGITWALESAERAAPIIAAAAKSWDPKYCRRWKHDYARSLGKKKRPCTMVKYILRTPPLIRDALLKASAATSLTRGVSKFIFGVEAPWI